MRGGLRNLTPDRLSLSHTGTRHVVNLTPQRYISNTCCLLSAKMKPMSFLLFLTTIVGDPLVIHPCKWGPNSEFICPGAHKNSVLVNSIRNLIKFHSGYDEAKSVPSNVKRVDALVPKTNRVDFAIKRCRKLQ